MNGNDQRQKFWFTKSKSIIPDTTFRFKQSGRHKDYLFFIYNFFFIIEVIVLIPDLENIKQLFSTPQMLKRYIMVMNLIFIHLVV